jgi:hypothetical protein
MNAEIEKCLGALRSRNMHGIFCENAVAATSEILKLIPQGAVVGIGDSTAVRQTGVLEALKEKGVSMLNPFDMDGKEMGPEQARDYLYRTMKKATVCDVFLTGTNAITLDGRIVNVDAVGNRVAGMFWGHPISIIAVGQNKIVPTLDEAFQRIRTVIAPNHIHIRETTSGRRMPKTPCVMTAKCRDCRVPDRICNIFTIIEGKPFTTEIHVVIVGEDLGLGWDPSWPDGRIQKIIENHKKYNWLPPFDIHEK